jgi:hypothetical protein
MYVSRTLACHIAARHPPDGILVACRRELRIEAEETVYRIQSRRRTEQDVRDLVQALRRPPPGTAS